MLENYWTLSAEHEQWGRNFNCLSELFTYGSDCGLRADAHVAFVEEL